MRYTLGLGLKRTVKREDRKVVTNEDLGFISPEGEEECRGSLYVILRGNIFQNNYRRPRVSTAEAV